MDVCCHDRRTARDRPSPYGNGDDFFLTVARGPVPRPTEHSTCSCAATKNVAWNVARGPVPRDLSTETRTVRGPRGPERLLSQSMPGEGQALALRWEEGCFRCRSAGACPPRSLRQNANRPQPKGPWTFAVTPGARRGTGPRPTII